MLILDKLTVKRNEIILAKDISITLLRGACISLVGRNGIGKTTLLRTIASLYEGYDGEITYNNVNIKEEINVYRSLICYIGHLDAINEQFTVKQDLLFWAELNNMIEGLSIAVSCFGLENYLDIPIGRLSAGWKKKVSLTKILLTNANIILLDEPFINLDEESVEILSNIIFTRCSHGVISILTSHINSYSYSCDTFNIGDFKND